MIEEQRREALAKFVRLKRDGISPEALSIPVSKRRRAAGLRREEVASLSGVGLTWYTWLEQGRDIKVSTAFLERVTSTLLMNPNEKRYVFSLAGKEVVNRNKPEFDEKRIAELNSILGAIKYPAYARNDCFDVLAWNKTNTEFFGDFGLVKPDERNVLTLMFKRSDYKRNMPKWYDDARDLVAKFRLSMAESQEVSRFSELVSHLMQCSDDFCEIWARHEVGNLGEGATLLSLDGQKYIAFKHYTVVPEDVPDAKIVFFVPHRRVAGQVWEPDLL